MRFFNRNQADQPEGSEPAVSAEDGDSGASWSRFVDDEGVAEHYTSGGVKNLIQAREVNGPITFN